MRTPIAVLVLTLTALTTFAGLAPVQRMSSNVQKPTEGRDLVFVQAADQDLYWTFYEALSTNVNLTQVKDLTGATNATFTFSPADRTWRTTKVGTVSTPSSGTVLFQFTGTNLEPNSLNGTFDYLISVNGSNGVRMAYVQGTLTILENVLSTAANLPNIDQVTIDWRNYFGFTNTSSYGPYRVGSGVSFTTNSDGSCNINASSTPPFDKTPTNSPISGRVLMSDGTTSNTYWAAVSGIGDMLTPTYDPANGARQVAFQDDVAWASNIIVDMYGLTNGWQVAVARADFASNTVVEIAGHTNDYQTAFGWGDHGAVGYVTNATITESTSNYVNKSGAILEFGVKTNAWLTEDDTNGWEVGTHTEFLTNASTWSSYPAQGAVDMAGNYMRGVSYIYGESGNIMFETYFAANSYWLSLNGYGLTLGNHAGTQIFNFDGSDLYLGVEIDMTGHNITNGATGSFSNLLVRGNPVNTNSPNSFLPAVPSLAPGDVLYVDASTNLTRRAKGIDGQSFVMSSGFPDWGTPTASATNAVSYIEAPGTTNPTATAIVFAGDGVTGTSDGGTTTVSFAAVQTADLVAYAGTGTVAALQGDFTSHTGAVGTAVHGLGDASLSNATDFAAAVHTQPWSTITNPPANTYTWNWALPQTNGALISATGTITRITSEANSGGHTGVLSYRYWTNAQNNVTALYSMPIVATHMQSNVSLSITAVPGYLELAVPTGGTNGMRFAVEMQP